MLLLIVGLKEKNSHALKCLDSSFLAPQAEAVAMAAETPQTDMSEETVMFKVLEGILIIA